MHSLNGGCKHRPARNTVTRLSVVPKGLYLKPTVKNLPKDLTPKKKLDKKTTTIAKNVRPKNNLSTEKCQRNTVGRTKRHSLQSKQEIKSPAENAKSTIKQTQKINSKNKKQVQHVSSKRKDKANASRADAKLPNSLNSMSSSEQLKDNTSESYSSQVETMATDFSVSSAESSSRVDRQLDWISISTKVFYSTPKITPRTPVKVVRVGLACTTRRTRRRRSNQMRLINKGVYHGVKRRPRTLLDTGRPPKSSNDADQVLCGLRSEKLRNLIVYKRKQNSQIEKLHQIFCKSKNPIEMARPLTALWSIDDTNNNLNDLSMTKTCQTDLVDADFSDIDCDNEVNAHHTNSLLSTHEMNQGLIIPLFTSHIIQLPTDRSPSERENVSAMKRKFFKSGSARTLKEVQITGHIRASVCKGKISLLQQNKPRRKTRSNKPLNKFSDEQATIDQILKDLDDNLSDNIPDAIIYSDRLSETPSNNVLRDEQQCELSNKALANDQQSKLETVILDDDDDDDDERVVDTVVLDDDDGELSEVETIELNDEFSELETILLTEDDDEPESNTRNEVVIPQNMICNDKFHKQLAYKTTNANIFIENPDNHKDDAKRIMDELILSGEQYSDEDSAIIVHERDQSDENVQRSDINNGDTLIGDMSPDDNEEFRGRLPYNTTDPELIRQQCTLLDFLITNNILSEETFTIFIADPDNHTEEANRIVDEVIGEEEEEVKINFQPENLRSRKDSALAEDGRGSLEETLSVPSIDFVQARSANKPPNRIEVISDEVIDVPMFYGYQPLVYQSTRRLQPSSIQCKYCGYVYSVYDPKEDQLHREYHASMHTLRFKGWIDEDVVAIFNEWSADGRILRLNNASHFKRRQRLVDILKIVEKELGFPGSVLPKIYMAYLAIRKQQIVGLCLVQPLERAHKYIYFNGIDCRTQEMFEAKCGITCLWISPLHRRLRIASKLIEAVRFNTIPGEVIPMDKIAFSAPTEMGKIFALKVSQLANFLVF